MQVEGAVFQGSQQSAGNGSDYFDSPGCGLDFLRGKSVDGRKRTRLLQ